jgi:hypothetical protein
MSLISRMVKAFCGDRLDSLRADVVLAWRRLRKSKVTSAAAILSLALAIGACLAAFQLVDALLLRPLPIAAPDRLYALSRQEFGMNGQSSTRDTWEYPLFREMRAAVASQADLIAISNAEPVEITFRSDREMEKAHVQYVSGDMFDTFGLHAASGRLLSQNDDLQPGAHPVAVVSHDYWSRRLAQDPQVIGRTFRITNNLKGTRIYQIVGVAEEGFTGTEPGKVVDIFLPAMMHWGMSFPGGRCSELLCTCNRVYRPRRYATTSARSFVHSTIVHSTTRRQIAWHRCWKWTPRPQASPRCRRIIVLGSPPSAYSSCWCC